MKPAELNKLLRADVRRRREPSNIPLEPTAGSHSLAAAAQRDR